MKRTERLNLRMTVGERDLINRYVEKVAEDDGERPSLLRVILRNARAYLGENPEPVSEGLPKVSVGLPKPGSWVTQIPDWVTQPLDQVTHETLLEVIGRKALEALQKRDSSESGTEFANNNYIENTYVISERGSGGESDTPLFSGRRTPSPPIPVKAVIEPSEAARLWVEAWNATGQAKTGAVRRASLRSERFVDLVNATLEEYADHEEWLAAMAWLDEQSADLLRRLGLDDATKALLPSANHADRRPKLLRRIELGYGTGGPPSLTQVLGGAPRYDWRVPIPAEDAAYTLPESALYVEQWQRRDRLSYMDFQRWVRGELASLCGEDFQSAASIRRVREWIHRGDWVWGRVASGSAWSGLLDDAFRQELIALRGGRDA